MNSLIDTHAHLCDPAFDPDLERILEKAEAAGIAAVIAVGENLEDAEKNLRLADRHPMLRPAAGLYPTILDRELADRMCRFIRNHRARLAAIGEVGLDYWMIQNESDRGGTARYLPQIYSVEQRTGPAAECAFALCRTSCSGGSAGGLRSQGAVACLRR